MGTTVDVVRRFKPRKEAIEATHEALPSDYEKLAQAVMHAIIFRKKDIILKLPYFVTFDDSFPKGLLVKKDEQHNFYRAKTFKVADWLHSKGYLPEDAKGIMKAGRELAYLEGRINKILDSPLDSLVQ